LVSSFTVFSNIRKKYLSGIYKKGLALVHSTTPYAVFVFVFVFVAGFSHPPDNNIIIIIIRGGSRLEGPGSTSALVVSGDPVVVASHPLHRRFRNRHWSRSIRLSRRFLVSSATRRPRSRPFNMFAHGGCWLVVGRFLKSHHHRSSRSLTNQSSPLKVASSRRTASWSRNFHVVESHHSIHSVSSVIPHFSVAATKSRTELSPLVLILVLLLSVLSVHRRSFFLVFWSLQSIISIKIISILLIHHTASSYFWLYRD
jgi:hypothetical protein